jgi:hypothetical protein
MIDDNLRKQMHMLETPMGCNDKRHPGIGGQMAQNARIGFQPSGGAAQAHHAEIFSRATDIGLHLVSLSGPYDDTPCMRAVFHDGGEFEEAHAARSPAPAISAGSSSPEGRAMMAIFVSGSGCKVSG